MGIEKTLAYYGLCLSSVHFQSGVVFTKLHFLRKLQIVLFSYSVTLQYTGNAGQGQTL